MICNRILILALELIPKPAQPCEAPPLYLRLRMGKPVDKKMSMMTPIMSYGKKKMKPEYWFSIPRDKYSIEFYQGFSFIYLLIDFQYARTLYRCRADSFCRFFLLWAPGVYGELTDARLAARGFQLIMQDLEWEQPARVPHAKPLKKLKLKKNRPRDVAGDPDQEDEEDDPLSMTAELAKESWEVRLPQFFFLFISVFKSASLVTLVKALK